MHDGMIVSEYVLKTSSSFRVVVDMLDTRDCTCGWGVHVCVCVRACNCACAHTRAYMYEATEDAIIKIIKVLKLIIARVDGNLKIFITLN